jgi:hypothetical protein
MRKTLAERIPNATRDLFIALLRVTAKANILARHSVCRRIEIA